MACLYANDCHTQWYITKLAEIGKFICYSHILLLLDSHESSYLTIKDKACYKHWNCTLKYPVVSKWPQGSLPNNTHGTFQAPGVLIGVTCSATLNWAQRLLSLHVKLPRRHLTEIHWNATTTQLTTARHASARQTAKRKRREKIRRSAYQRREVVKWKRGSKTWDNPCSTTEEVGYLTLADLGQRPCGPL